ncbi:MAG: 3-oxoadipate enol-lactonase [Rhodospirillaceae bacterium]|jgi:3-oxoadipate enol-lactonase|nr:3-oxoadipate enol-lactonase [Rhodospirillaceae bacterium]MBT4491502.1 3-oxoadipate enol-lactonase [Rhodospirillaceae bacterium]MBT5193676.1 3-oxoadipate enol-lactonase [Rhodospirillaceae bacterium]MBT5897890.1 3-oxoadipate enol-lactonase [Rhodospirillaceae bacterium]MBT6428991.1 3-oxoadipate enol-lactonase [Rhodospirillaceae bacterium]
MKFLGNRISIEYEVFGPEGAPVVMLSHSLGSSSVMWAPQLPKLAESFRVVCMDTRGHGGTAAPEGEYSLDMLGDDALALMDGLEMHQVHWVGLSMGGMIGQNIALRQTGRFKSLTLCDTSARMPEEGRNSWRDRIAIVSEQGMEPLADPTMERWFTAPYLEQAPSSVEAIRAQFLATKPAGFIGCCHALRTLDYLDELPAIDIPTMIIVGAQDMGTPVAASEAMQAQIPSSQLVVLEDAAHLSNIEQADGFTSALMGFLNAQ